MAQKLLKHELVERLLQLKEKQDLLTVQMQLFTQEISELAAPFVPKTPKSQSVITTRLIAQVLRGNQGTWLMCGDIAEQALQLVGQPQFVDVAKWLDYYDKRTFNPETGKPQYTHRRLRSAYRSLMNNLPYLFTYQKYPGLGIPNTSNLIEGQFEHLKRLLGNHRRMNLTQKLKMIDEILGV